MSILLQSRNHLRADHWLDGNFSALKIAAAAAWRGASAVFDAGLVASLLDVHVKVDQIDENLHVPLGLHVSSHHAETKPGLAVPGHHGRNDRVKRPLVRFEPIHVRVIQGKRRAAVLHDKANLTRHDVRTERAEIALDERTSVSVFIDDAQINRVTMHRLRIAWRNLGGCPLHVQQLASFGRIFLRDQFPGRKLIEVRIGVEYCPVGEGELFGFQKQVKPLGAAAAHLRTSETADGIYQRGLQATESVPE